MKTLNSIKLFNLLNLLLIILCFLHLRSLRNVKSNEVFLFLLRFRFLAKNMQCGRGRGRGRVRSCPNMEPTTANLRWPKAKKKKKVIPTKIFLRDASHLNVTFK